MFLSQLDASQDPMCAPVTRKAVETGTFPGDIPSLKETQKNPDAETVRTLCRGNFESCPVFQELMERIPTNQFDQIIWPTTEPFGEILSEETTRKTIELLCENGIVTGWSTEGRYAGAKVPHTYNIHGTKVQFLPHSSYYSIEGMNLNPPTSQEDLLRDIESVKYLQSRGWLRPNSL